MYTTLPRGPHGLSPAVVEASQRRRIVEATAALVGERGYAAMRLAEVARTAGVSLSTIYARFGDKEELFLACYQAGSDTHCALVGSALRVPGTPEVQAAAAIGAYLGLLEQGPPYARAFFSEAQVATPRIRARFLDNQLGYARLVADWHRRSRRHDPKLPAIPEQTWAGVVAGIAGLVTERLRRGSVDGIAGALGPHCLHLVLAVAGCEPAGPAPGVEG